MDINVFIKNYIDAYENHFNNENRNNATFENMEYAGWLLDRYFPEFTKDATAYITLYNKCKRTALMSI